jgi:lysophospholipase L1-like esterase
MTLAIKPGQKLLMIGDSVTDCERARPVGEGLFGALGKGYVQYVDGLLSTAYPGHHIRVLNLGTSGNTVVDLKQRWQTDVLAHKPDWVSIMIGINDVWRQFDLPRQRELHVLPAVYAKTLEQLVIQTKPKVAGLVLMTPFYIEPNPADAMRERMDEYGEIVRQIATKHRLRLVDTQAAFNRLLEHIYPAAIAWDRVHPNHIGHQVLARAFLEAVGYEWNGA